MDDIKNLDDGVDVNDEKKARRKSFSRISHRLSTTKEDDASDSSTDFEQETPSACAFYREALTHYHCWLVFSFPSAFQFSVVERWTLGSTPNHASASSLELLPFVLFGLLG
eukprot:1362160-Amorphochlora_amoeboformis.AAC.1